MDEKHFDSIYAAYSKPVFNLCLNYVLNSEDAQDITQEVFVKVYQKYDQFNPTTASIKTWIFQIAINKCLDFIKAKKTKKRFGFLTSLMDATTNEQVEIAVTVSHPGVATEEKEGVENLLKIIYTLPESQKTAIILTKIDGRPQREVAEIMGTTLKSVESLLQRAKQTISKKLTDTKG